MKFCVCMKQVPDTQKVKVDPEKGTLVRKGIPSITNPFDESALELALHLREKIGGTITVITMGIPDSELILRDALSLGADQAFLLTGSDFAGADTLATGYALSKAIEKTGPFDILLFGKQAIDGDTAQVGPEVSVFLGIPVIAFVSDIIEINPCRIKAERLIDNGKEVVECEYPVLLTVIKAPQRLRMPTMQGLLRSFNIPVQKIEPSEIGADLRRCGLRGSPTRVKKIFTPNIRSRVRFIEGNLEEKAKGIKELIEERISNFK